MKLYKSHEKNHRHEHDRQHGTHAHVHGVVDPTIITTQRGIWAVKWSFVGLCATAGLQAVVVLLSGSVALLADTIHNIGDAATAIPLWIAFTLARFRPSQRFTYGYGRVEDLAGLLIVVIILISALVAGSQSIHRLLHPQPIEHIWIVACAAFIGFAGNEIVALFRIRIGREINSAALIADGYHARVDGLTSLGVLIGAIGVWLGYPKADPVAGLLITIVIFRIVWQSGKSVLTRLLDGVDPEVIEEIKHALKHTDGVHHVSEVRVRWLGHRLHAEANVSVSEGLSVAEGHEIAKEVRHSLMHHLSYLSNVTIHVDPTTASGEEHHSINEHAHDDLPNHSHK